MDGPDQQLIDAAHEFDIWETRARRAPPMALHDGGEAEPFYHANDGRVECLACKAESDQSDVEHGGDCTTWPHRTFLSILSNPIRHAPPGSAHIDRFARMTAPSVWSPLRRPLFRALWIADVVSNVGTWMHDAAAAWLMTLLAPSPVMVSLVQAAPTLALFLLALPAGALADVLDRRRILLVA